MKTYLKKNRAYFIGALICVLFSNGFAVILQFLKGDVLDHAIAGETQATLQYALLLIAFILLEILFYFCYKRLGAKFAAACARHLKHDIFASILRRDYVSYKRRTQGEYIAKYTTEADMIKARRFSMLTLFWEILFKILFVSAALFVLDVRIALLTIALLTTPLYLPKLIEKRLQRAQAQYLKAAEECLSKVEDWLSGFEIIKNFSIERQIMRRFDQANDAAMEKLLRDTQLGATAQLITTLISYLSYFLVLSCAAYLVLRGDFTAGDFFIAIGMVDQLSYPLISLAEIIRQLVAIRPTCASVEAFISEPGDAQGDGGPKNLRREIRFRDVTFAYEGQAPILENFNIVVEKGKRYLLRGPSGCGKTTAVNLLLRYYDAASGSVEIDGLSVQDMDSAYGCVTVVRQEAILFHDTLRNNLTMYRDIPDVRLIKTLEALGLDKFANADALEGLVAEGGANLSGGEKRRICLARALLRDTDVLILDEPLANLDQQTAERIEDLLLSIADKTVLVVSHQFSPEKLRLFHQVTDFAAR